MTEPVPPHGALDRDLADGYRLRDAGEADREVLVDLMSDRMGDEVAAEAVAALDELGVHGWTVVEHEGEVVSCSTLLEETWRLDGVSLAVGMPDFVATRSAHEGRGLFRAQLDVHHARSRDHGDAVQAIVGIPYYYRRFGYSYPLATQHALPLRAPVPAAPDGVQVRPVDVSDLPALAALQAAAQAGAGLRMDHSAATVRCMLACPHLELLAAERDGDVVATARLYRDDGTVHVLDLAGAPDGVDALLAAAASGTAEVRVQRRPDPTLLARLEDRPARAHSAVFVRVPDLVRVLDLLRPVLSARLAEAPLRDVPTSLRISRYTDAAELQIRDRTVTTVEPCPPARYHAADTLRVPPDEVPSLLFGPHGASALEERHPDVLLGDRRDLAEVLFPPVVADLLTWVPPY